MKMKAIIKDKLFRLFTCFYLFVGFLVFQLEAYSKSNSGNEESNIFISAGPWYSEPWVWAVLTAVLILLVASSGREKRSFHNAQS